MSLLALLSLVIVVGCAQKLTVPPPAAPSAATTRSAVDPWEKEISAFEAQDRATPMPKDSILFYGSSSVRGWKTLQSDFPGLPVVNRGFGGSTADAGVRHLDRVVIPNRPKTLVLYFGDNDLAEKRSPERVTSDIRELVMRVHAALPETRILFLAIKPSPSRIGLIEAQRATNSAVQAMAEADPKLDYVDVATPMLDANGQPRAELYLADQLHMTPAGYELWTKVLAPFLK